MTPTVRLQIAQLIVDIEQSRCSLGVNGALLQQLGRVVFDNWQGIDLEGKRLRSVETAARQMVRGLDRRHRQPPPMRYITPWGEAAALYRAIHRVDETRAASR